jgi:hypothetical protein
LVCGAGRRRRVLPFLRRVCCRNTLTLYWAVGWGLRLGVFWPLEIEILCFSCQMVEALLQCKIVVSDV